MIKEEIENEFPYLNQKNVQFISNGLQIKPLKTLEHNNIKDQNVILVLFENTIK